MILIKDMDMPENCESCDLLYDCMQCIIPTIKHRVWDGAFDPGAERDPECPLTEVESYGPAGTLYKEKR